MSISKKTLGAKNEGARQRDIVFRPLRGGSAAAQKKSKKKGKVMKSGVAPKEERVSESLRIAIERRKERDAHTYGLYCLKRKGNKHWQFMPPFLAVSDDCALNAVIEMSHTEPSLCGDNLYRMADFCSLDGKIKALKTPRLIVHRSKV